MDEKRGETAAERDASFDTGGPPCSESQADGVPCEEVGADCEDCDQADPEAREVYKARGSAG